MINATVVIPFSYSGNEIWCMKSITAITSLLIVILTACSTSNITSSWKEKDVQPLRYRKIMVLGLINGPDRNVRESMETNIASGLNRLGYSAVCACDEFNPKAFEGLSEKEALAKISDKGIDAVLTVVLLDKSKEKFYMPARVHYSPYAVYHSRFYGYYHTMYLRVYSPGYYTTTEKYFWESNFYSVDSTTRLLYSAQSQSFDQAISSLSYQYSEMIIRDMLKSNIIKDFKHQKVSYVEDY